LICQKYTTGLYDHGQHPHLFAEGGIFLSV
jgi:hypothetical protein